MWRKIYFQKDRSDIAVVFMLCTKRRLQNNKWFYSGDYYGWVIWSIDQWNVRTTEAIRKEGKGP